MSNQDPPQTVRLTLSPHEGQQLSALLAEVPDSGDPETDFSGLDQLLDSLGDANALAIWLRENVNVELEGQVAAQVMEVLDNISADGSADPRAAAVLPVVQTKLARYLPQGHSAAVIN